jgi:D-glycerate 3-kinase
MKWTDDTERTWAKLEPKVSGDMAAVRHEVGLSDAEGAAMLPVVGRVACWIAERMPADHVPLVAVSGAQGTGKSTVARLISFLLERGFGSCILTLSIDDFYLTREERRQLGESVHPLFATRGVPGTHDMTLLRQVIDAAQAGQPIAVPRFDKSVDDRGAPEQWQGPADLIILEGWCVGVGPMDPATLAEPMNRLEAVKDGDGRWRGYVQARLGDADYRAVFGAFDSHVFLAAPGMPAVVAWRTRQEALLEQKTGRRLMSPEQIEEFVMHYERVTKHALASVPGTADIVIALDEDHRMMGVTSKHG